MCYIYSSCAKLASLIHEALGWQIADNAGNGNRMWSQMTAELTVHVPHRSAWSPSGVCLTRTWAKSSTPLKLKEEI